MRRSKTALLLPETSDPSSPKSLTHPAVCPPNRLDRHLPPITKLQDAFNYSDSLGDNLNQHHEEKYMQSYGNIKRSASETRIRKKTGHSLLSLPTCLSFDKVG